MNTFVRRLSSGVLVAAFLSLIFLSSYSLFAEEARDVDTPPGPWHELERYAHITRPEKGDEVSMSDEVRAFVDSMLSDSRMGAASKTFAHSDAWGSLGPDAPAGPERHELPRPEETRTLDLPEPGGDRGSGTADDPWRGVIGEYLSQYEFTDSRAHPNRIRARFDRRAEGFPTETQWPSLDSLTQDYMGELDYSPYLLEIPAGHYIESTVTVPPGFWLKADGRVVIRPELGEGGVSSPLIDLHIRSGLEGAVLNADNVPSFRTDVFPCELRDNEELRVRSGESLTAVLCGHGAYVVDNHIKNFTHSGIRGAGTRGNKGSYVHVLGNVIENIGYSGIRTQLRWLVMDNHVRHCGYLRPSGAGGDDGIIVSESFETVVVNNIIIGGRGDAERAAARHVLSGQRPVYSFVAGNISIADGATRNNVGFSDGAHYNFFIGNLVLGTGSQEGWSIQAGFSLNGYGNTVEYNAVFDNSRGARTGSRWDEETANLIRNNYFEYRRGGIHRSGSRGVHYIETGNNWNRFREAKAELNPPEDFGLFIHRRDKD